MAHEPSVIREERELTPEEVDLIGWLLEHGRPEAQPYLAQLAHARVFSRCPCGCASIDLSIAGKRPTDFRMQILSDYQWRSKDGHLFGAFVFAQDQLLAGLDLWSIDGQATATTLPSQQDLVPLGHQYV